MNGSFNFNFASKTLSWLIKSHPNLTEIYLIKLLCCCAKNCHDIMPCNPSLLSQLLHTGHLRWMDHLERVFHFQIHQFLSLWRERYDAPGGSGYFWPNTSAFPIKSYFCCPSRGQQDFASYGYFLVPLNSWGIIQSVFLGMNLNWYQCCHCLQHLFFLKAVRKPFNCQISFWQRHCLSTGRQLLGSQSQ